MMVNLTGSAFADFILISFVIVIAITLIIDRIRIIVIEISREREKRRYEEQRRKELLTYEEKCRKINAKDSVD